MNEKDIIQNMISRLGQNQNGRMPEELRAHFADIDERNPEELLLWARRFSRLVNYYRSDVSAPAGDWESFFPLDTAEAMALRAGSTGNVPAHLALFCAFLELYEKQREVINRITGRHLDFYYKDVLRLANKPAAPDRTHVLIELKKNASPILIGPEHLFSAGKDSTGVELIYAPIRETVINTGRIDSIRSLFADNRGHGTLRYAPIANSSDGVGGKLEGDAPKWHGFGNEKLPPAEVGFAIASPVLRMSEGVRNVSVFLTLDNVDRSRLSNDALDGAFEVFLTGEKYWIGPYSVSPAIDAREVLQFDFTIPATEKAVVDYDPAIHGYSYTAQAPIMHVLLKSENSRIGYNDFRGISLRKARVAVEVSGIESLRLESDAGMLDPKKAFLPFGPQPSKGSRFMVGYPEALSKKLSEVAVTIQWKDAPGNFSTYYNGYGASTVNNGYFTATVSFEDAGTWKNTSYGTHLFGSGSASSPHTITFKAGAQKDSTSVLEGMRVHALHNAGTVWASHAGKKYVQIKPVLEPFRKATIEPAEGFITFTLERGFLHATYRKKYIENVMAYAKQRAATPGPVILNEPYTPTVQSLSLSYKAHSDTVNIASSSIDDYANPDVHFFHIAYFGQMREHRYQREQFSFVTDKRVALLPQYSSEGEMLIGIKDLHPGDSVSVLFQVAEGSADPDIEPEDISWSVLCDNYWKPLDRSRVVLDTTNRLLTSGIITFFIPGEATTVNSVLPPDHIWLKGAASRHATAVSRLIDVAANAVEVQFIEKGNDPGHLSTALKAGAISKLRNGSPSVKSVKQPYASFGGNPAELDEAFHTRVSERLRHKNRCVTVWEYERVVLEAFPNVHKVKCIPHARDGCWLAPGNVLLVVVPDLRNKNAADRLKPKVDAGTINRITDFVQKRAGMQVKVHVKNPSYQKIQLDLKVRFRTGYEFNYYSKALDEALIRFLSPWAYDVSRDISFGGKVYKSVLLDFVEDLDYVDYVTDFKMYSYAASGAGAHDVNESQPERPDAILVSAEAHKINEVAP